MKLSNKFKSVAIAASLGLAFATPIQAGVIATAILDITNFMFTDGNGNALDNINDIQIVSGNNFGTLSADINSIGGIASANQDETILSPSGGQFDGVQQCQGNCLPFANNDYSQIVPPVTATTSYAHSDNNLQGASIALDLDGNGTLDLPAGVTAQTRADVMLDSNDSGTSTSTTGTNASLTFIATEDLAMQLDFDVSAQTFAYVSTLTSAAPSSATAGVGWNLILDNLTDGTSVEFAPDQLQLTSARNDFSAQFNEIDNKTFNGSISQVFNLIAGNSYQLGISHQVQANATNTNVVPEPGILALFSLGLIGGAFSLRRKNS